MYSPLQNRIMNQKLFFILLVFIVPVVCFGQKKAKLKFTSINQFGTLSGESSTEFQMQSINGFNYKSISACVGIGMDYYVEATYPLFLDLRTNIFNKASTPFIYADGGYSCLSKKSLGEYEMDRKGGAYYAAGIGYEFPVNGKVKAVIDCGYSYKQFSKIIDNEPWRSSVHSFDTYDYSLNRISIRAGLRF